jgi:hypothetical protein
MLPTDGKTTNGFENKIRWSFFNPLEPAILFEKTCPTPTIKAK